MQNKCIIEIANNYIPKLTDMTEVIDCSDMIISPASSTHIDAYSRHNPRTGTAMTLLGTMNAWILGWFFLWWERYVYWWAWWCLENIDTRMMTVLAHMHVEYSIDHVNAVMEGLLGSDIGAFFFQLLRWGQSTSNCAYWNWIGLHKITLLFCLKTLYSKCKELDEEIERRHSCHVIIKAMRPRWELKDVFINTSTVIMTIYFSSKLLQPSLGIQRSLTISSPTFYPPATIATRSMVFKVTFRHLSRLFRSVYIWPLSGMNQQRMSWSRYT